MGDKAKPSWDEYDQRWHDIWNGKLQPGEKFDLGRATPALVAALTSGELDVKGKRVFVPGCGRGYDVVEFARWGADPAVGIDLSSSGVQAAVEYRDSCNLPESEAARAQVIQGNFFNDKFEPADVGYDYTFLCALHPDMRQAWAETWGSIIKPGGELVTLIFPLEPPGREGPPWPLQLELYQDLLLPHGFEQVVARRVPDDVSSNGAGAFTRKGKEMFAVWRKV